MATTSSRTRSDIVYLRRRTRAAASPDPQVASVVPVAPSGVSAPSAGLNLSLARDVVTPDTVKAPSVRRPRAAPRPQSPAELLFAAPGIGDIAELTSQLPVVRLNARQSAIGSLLVAGSSAVAWESTSGITGAAMPDGETFGTPVETSGNRPLVGYDEGEATVSLRHIRELRRAIFIGRGPVPLGVRIFDAATVTVSAITPETMFVLLLLRVDGVVELRAERIHASTPDREIWQEFGFTMTPLVAAHRIRSH